MAHIIQSALLPSESYVLALVSHRDCFAASASSPSDAIHLLEKSNLQHIGTLQGHAGGITALRSVQRLAGTNSETLISSGHDGTLKVWDHRSNQIAIKMNSPKNAPLLSFDVSLDGNTVAAGSELNGDDASILYWDARKSVMPMYAHTSTHAEDVTVVQFNPVNNTLLSASSDGLLNISDPMQPDEDEAVIQVSNWGTSIAQAGWKESGVWASSDMETFSLWSPDLDKTADFNLKDLNQTLPPNRASWEPDYLISCQPSANNLSLFVGSNSGSLSVLSPPSNQDSGWIQHCTYPSYHDGIVRTILWDEQTGFLLTGGEDSKIHLWNAPPPDSSVKSPRKREHDVGDDMEVDNEAYKKARRN